MTTRNLAAILPDAAIWTQIQAMRAQARLFQAGLVIVPPTLAMEPFLDKLLAHIVCMNAAIPCANCRMCLSVLGDSHPDIYKIQPEKPNGSIKIEQIRALQNVAYQTPQIDVRQIFVIYPAEAMNQAAASALLKILEEPAASTMFILITSNASLILPTIISRCIPIHVTLDAYDGDPLSMGTNYTDSSVRGKLYAQRLLLLTQMDDLVAKRSSPCDVAQLWSEYPIDDMLWFFTLVLSKLILLSLIPDSVVETEYQSHAIFVKLWRPEYLYPQLDQVYAIQSQLQDHINLNAILVWERILLDFLEDYSRC